MNLKKILAVAAVATFVAGAVSTYTYVVHDLGYHAGRISVLQDEIHEAEKRLEELSGEMGDSIKYDFGRRL